MTIHLVIAEHDGKSLKKATLSAISAARQVEGAVHGLVMGSGVQSVADELAQYVGKVHLADDAQLEHNLSQPAAQIVLAAADAAGADMVWMAATGFGKDLCPRVAVRLDGAMASDVSEVISRDTFKRPMWAGDLLGTVQIHGERNVVSVRPTEFPAAEPTTESGEVQALQVPELQSRMRFVSFDEVKSDRPALTDAKVVVSGGRGLKNADDFKKIMEPLADKLNAAIGASRAVCDAGWVPNDWQVGQTGKVVAPNLYFAIGISGAIQHVAGMKGSKVVVAINKDPEAPIFQVADYGLVADAFQAVPELVEKL